MAAPTREDAQLMMQILQWGNTLGLKEAFPSLLADGFDPETADPMDDAVGTVLTFVETIGAFVKLDLLSRELVDEVLWVKGIWERVGPAALKAREQAGEPRIYENFEALAAASA